MKVCIVSSCGGHLVEARALEAAYRDLDHFFVINEHVLLPPEARERTYLITHSERDWRFLVNLAEAFRILRRERPDVILSTGAGPAVPFAIVGRLLFSMRVVFVETIARTERPSLTGRLMYWLAHEFFYQWPGLAGHYRRGRLGGPLL